MYLHLDLSWLRLAIQYYFWHFCKRSSLASVTLDPWHLFLYCLFLYHFALIERQNPNSLVCPGPSLASRWNILFSRNGLCPVVWTTFHSHKTSHCCFIFLSLNTCFFLPHLICDSFGGYKKIFCSWEDDPAHELYPWLFLRSDGPLLFLSFILEHWVLLLPACASGLLGIPILRPETVS